MRCSALALRMGEVAVDELDHPLGKGQHQRPPFAERASFRGEPLEETVNPCFSAAFVMLMALLVPSTGIPSSGDPCQLSNETSFKSQSQAEEVLPTIL